MIDAHLVSCRLQLGFIWKLAMKEDKWQTWTAFAVILIEKTVVLII